jgi:1,4-dihydroxy-6-naphthoate synthase
MIQIAISPCPNDTYLFHAWISGLVGTPPDAIFADIQQLNEFAYEEKYPLIKISFNCFKNVQSTYQLLPIGSALGFHCGPKIIAKTPFSLDELSQKRIAIPGKDTTAHLLLNKFFPDLKKKSFCLYNQVADLIANDEVECGLIIHETRFTFASMGFYEIADLGELWQEKFNLPLPLGGLAIHCDYPDKEKVVTSLKQSLNFAQNHPNASLPFILKHSQEKNSEAVKLHIETYVNEETANLTDRGLKAIETLTGVCLKNSLYLPKEAKPTLRCTL